MNKCNPNVLETMQTYAVYNFQVENEIAMPKNKTNRPSISSPSRKKTTNERKGSVPGKEKSFHEKKKTTFLHRWMRNKREPARVAREGNRGWTWWPVGDL